MNLDRWGRMAREYLKSYRPQEYRRLRKSGQLMPYILEKQNYVADQVEELRSYLEANTTLPVDSLDKVACLNGLQRRAEEIVIAEHFPL